jgi:hypothetical protein
LSKLQLATLKLLNVGLHEMENTDKDVSELSITENIDSVQTTNTYIIYAMNYKT